MHNAASPTQRVFKCVIFSISVREEVLSIAAEKESQKGMSSAGFPLQLLSTSLGNFELDPTVILGPGETPVPSTALTLTFEICCG